VRQWAGGGIKDPVCLISSGKIAVRSFRETELRSQTGSRSGRRAGWIMLGSILGFGAVLPGAIGALAKAAVSTVERYDDLTNVVDTIRQSS